MPLPYEDSYSIRFHSFADMADYHADQSARSRWERAPVNSLRVEPLDQNSPLCGDISQFEAGVSEGAVRDTAKSLGLAIRLNGKHFPLRDTAYKSLLERARISGTALAKLRRGDLADTLNSCLALARNDQALLLVREQKVSAVHSGNAKDYSVLPVIGLLDALKSMMDERFAGSGFEGGHSDHALTGALWSLPGQKGELLKTYCQTIAGQGKPVLASKLMPGIRFCTSDVGVSSAKAYALLLGLRCPVSIGGAVATDHDSQRTIADFRDSVEMLFAKFGDSVRRLERLASVRLEYPANAMMAVCKRLSLPKAASLEAIGMFEMACGGGGATAHDAYFAMQEIMFILKTANTPESKMLRLEETMALALALDWSQHDTAKAVGW